MLGGLGSLEKETLRAWEVSDPRFRCLVWLARLKTKPNVIVRIAARSSIEAAMLNPEPVCAMS